MESSGNLQPWSIATVTSVTALALVVVCLRLLSRYERRQTLWWDDYMICWSMGWMFITYGFIIAMVHNGMGLHAADVPMVDIVMVAKLLVVAEILYVFNLVWTKLSLLMMYYRIFRFPYFKKWAYAIGAFIIAWVICITFLFIFICVPVQKLWYPQLPGRCINQVGTWIANAASTIITDILILLLPIPQIWKLKLRKPEKVALTVTFALGAFVIFASAYRFSVLFSYSNADPTYTLAPTVGWTAIEMAAGIISACLPTLRPAFEFMVRKLGIKPLVGLFRSAGESRLGLSRPGLSEEGKKPTPVDGVKGSISQGQKGSQGGFYRLSDETKSHESDGALDSRLRPEHGYGYTVKSEPGCKEPDILEGDNIPLKGIRVQTEFSQHRA
ncbi:hypothetical protein B0O99DRAFT_22140 [Bisporella sp. PMI_857]|nr:hypothetical protein B0O99DRAFT_22140 [Bisporella sp. PMI_857]